VPARGGRSTPDNQQGVPIDVETLALLRGRRGVVEDSRFDERAVTGPAMALKLTLHSDLGTGAALAHTNDDSDHAFDLQPAFVARGRLGPFRSRVR
jgi:hypothetical protein